MKVRDALTARKVVTINANDTCDLAKQVMSWSGIRHLPVIRGPTLVGIVSERDLLRHSSGPTKRVEELMTSPVHSLSADCELDDAKFLMGSEKVGCLPVLNGGVLIGILTASDLLQVNTER